MNIVYICPSKMEAMDNGKNNLNFEHWAEKSQKL